MKKVMLTLDEGLTEDEVIIYRGGKLLCVNIHELLPELLEIKDNIRNLSKAEIQDFQEIHKLKDRDLFIAKSLYDNYVERGIIDENEEFDAKFNAFIFENGELHPEDMDADFVKILDKLRGDEHE